MSIKYRIQNYMNIESLQFIQYIIYRIKPVSIIVWFYKEKNKDEYKLCSY